MPRRESLVLIVLVALTAIAAYGLGQRAATPPATAAQGEVPVWNSAMLWSPSLGELGDTLAGHVNQIDAGCALDVDPVVTTNGAGPDGSVYAVTVSWACPQGGESGAVWNAATLWYPTLAESGDGLAGVLNQLDARCAVDVDRLVATNGSGPEGPVYAFAVTWAC